MNASVSTTQLDVSADLEALRDRWGWFVGLGVLMLVLGCVAMGQAFLVSIASMLFFGWLLAIGGAVASVQAFWQERGWSGFFLSLLGGLLYLATGLLIVGHPGASAAAMTLLMAMLLLFSGIFRCVAAIAYRFPHGGLLLAHGVLSVLLGGLLVAKWPVSGLWFIGFCLGLELALNGATAIGFGLMLRSAPKTAAAEN